MFLTQRYLKRIEREREAAKAEGIAEGKAEGEAKGEAKGIAKGKAEGEAKERELWIAWNNRRLEAEAKGEEFNEPPPTETQHPTE